MLRKKTQGRVVCAELTQQGLAVAAVSQASDLPPQLHFNGFFPISEDETDVATMIKASLQEVGLSKSPVHGIMAPGDYQLHLIDKPNVPEAEMKEAVLWSLQGQLEGAPEDYLIDFFTCPASESGLAATDQKLFAVTTLIEHVENLQALFEKAGAHLQSLSVPELALASLVRHLPGQDSSVALVVLGEQHPQLCIMDAGGLAYVRALPTLDADSDHEAFLRECSRALDLQASRRAIKSMQVLVTPSIKGCDALVNALNDRCNYPAATLSVADLFPEATLYGNTTTTALLTVMGGALHG